MLPGWREAWHTRCRSEGCLAPVAAVAGLLLVSTGLLPGTPYRAWRPLGVAQGLQTPPGTPYRVWRPSEVTQGLQTPPGTPYLAWRPSGVAQALPDNVQLACKGY